jgi:hypothetical protein
MTNCDTAIGGTTGEWGTGDNTGINLDSHTIRATIHVDTDLASSEPLWMEPNCLFVEVQQIQQTEPDKGSGGGLMMESYWGRIDYIALTRLATDNDTTYKDVFHEDSSGRWGVGWQLEDGSWVEACPEYRGFDIPNEGGCDPILLGWDDGTGDSVGDISSGGIRLFMVFEDRGPVPYKVHPGAYSWTMVFSIGSDADWHTYTVLLTLTADSSDNS